MYCALPSGLEQKIKTIKLAAVAMIRQVFFRLLLEFSRETLVEVAD